MSSPLSSTLPEPERQRSVAGRTARGAVLAALALFVAVTAALHFRFTDPFRTYCEDLEHFTLPRTAYTYQHPWEAYLGRPTPSINFGTSNYLTDGDPAAVFPPLTAILALLAPRDPGRLARFEWRLTSLYVLGSMTAIFFFARGVGAGWALAAALACAYPFTFTVFSEWRHADLMRGRLMIAPVLCGLLAATGSGGIGGWLALALAVVLCLAQATQLYWVAVLVAYFLAWAAWRERRRLLGIARSRRLRALPLLLPPLMALGLAVVALGPVYYRGQQALRQSALYDELAHDPERLLFYLRDGRDWFSLSGLTALGGGFLHFSLAGLALHLAVAARRRGAGRERSAAGPCKGLAGAGLLLLLASLLLAFVPDLSDHLVTVRHGRVELQFAPLAVPASAAVLFHTTLRTWLLLAEIGGLMLGLAALARWIGEARPGRERAGDALLALGILVGLQAAASAISSEPWPSASHGGALAAAGLTLAAAAVHGSADARWRALGGAGLVALGVATAGYTSSLYYRKGISNCSHGLANAANILARDRTLLERMPPEVRGQREHRLFGEKWCYWLDAPCALSYGLRALPRDVLRFFQAAETIDDVQLPYWLYLNYPRLIETGIAQMLGIRWWVLPEDIFDGGIVLTEAPDARRLLEAKGVFPKAWALETWETADSFEAAVARVIELGTERALDRRGVVQTPSEQPLVLPPASPPVGAERATVEVMGIEPGELRLRVRSAAPTVLATNEFLATGWRVEIDGVEAPALRVNAAFVGVAVPAGEHLVEIER